MAAPHKRTLRQSLRSALSHKNLADEVLDSINDTQTKFNTTMTKLDADTAVKEITSVVTVADVSDDLDGTTFILQDEAGSVGFWIDTDDSGTTIPAEASGADRAVEITTIATDDTAATIRGLLVTAIGADSQFTAANGVSDEVLVTDISFGIRAAASASTSGFTVTEDTAGVDIDINYNSTGAVTDLFDPDVVGTSAQHKTNLRKSLRSSLSHKKLADEIVDAIEELQVGYNAMLVKLDAEAGNFNDTNYSSTLILTLVTTDAAGTGAQHKETFRKSLKSALNHSRLADQILDAITTMQTSFNATLVLLDAGTIGGTEHVANQVTAILPDAT